MQPSLRKSYQNNSPVCLADGGVVSSLAGSLRGYFSKSIGSNNPKNAAALAAAGMGTAPVPAPPPPAPPPNPNATPDNPAGIKFADGGVVSSLTSGIRGYFSKPTGSKNPQNAAALAAAGMGSTPPVAQAPVAPPPPPNPNATPDNPAGIRFADGGTVSLRRYNTQGDGHGGMVRGPGTGTSDSIPARLSNGEAVLPEDTVDAIGPEAVQKLIDSTHTPVARRPSLRGGFADGTAKFQVHDPRYDVSPLGAQNGQISQRDGAVNGQNSQSAAGITAAGGSVSSSPATVAGGQPRTQVGDGSALSGVPTVTGTSPGLLNGISNTLRSAYPVTSANVQGAGEAMLNAAGKGDVKDFLGQTLRGGIKGVGGFAFDTYNAAARPINGLLRGAYDVGRVAITGENTPTPAAAPSAQSVPAPTSAPTLRSTAPGLTAAPAAQQSAPAPAANSGIRRIDGGSSPLFTNMPDGGMLGNDNLMNRGQMSLRNQGALDNLAGRYEAEQRGMAQASINRDQEAANLRAQVSSGQEFGGLRSSQRDPRQMILDRLSQGKLNKNGVEALQGLSNNDTQLRGLRMNRDVQMRGQDITQQGQLLSNNTQLRGQDITQQGQFLTNDNARTRMQYDMRKDARDYTDARGDKRLEQDNTLFAQGQTARTNDSKALDDMFQTKDSDGKMVVDAQRKGAFQQMEQQELGKIINQLQRTGSPAALKEAERLSRGGPSLMDAEERAKNMQRFQMKELAEQTHGNIYGDTSHKPNAAMSLGGYDIKSRANGKVTLNNGTVLHEEKLQFGKDGNVFFPNLFKKPTAQYGN